MDILCESCGLMETARKANKKIIGCDLNDLTKFCKDAGRNAIDPPGLWSLMHFSTCLKGNKGCKAYYEIGI